MNKKAQSQIITTVLIILLVLAAIVIVWQVVNTTVQGGSDEITSTSSCIGLSLEAVSADANGNLATITRKAGGPTGDLSNVVLLVDGAVVTHTCPDTDCTLGELESKIYTITGTPDPLTAADQTVAVGSELTGGTKCDSVASVLSVDTS